MTPLRADEATPPNVSHAKHLPPVIEDKAPLTHLPYHAHPDRGPYETAVQF